MAYNSYVMHQKNKIKSPITWQICIFKKSFELFSNLGLLGGIVFNWKKSLTLQSYINWYTLSLEGLFFNLTLKIGIINLSLN